MVKLKGTTYPNKVHCWQRRSSRKGENPWRKYDRRPFTTTPRLSRKGGINRPIRIETMAVLRIVSRSAFSSMPNQRAVACRLIVIGPADRLMTNDERAANVDCLVHNVRR